MKDVVITGIGIISPIGNNKAEFTCSLREGLAGKGAITRFETGKFPFKEAYEVKNFNPHKFGVHIMDPFIQYAVGATHDALEDARLDLQDIDPYRIGLSVSSSKGGVSTIDRFKDRFAKNPSAILGARIYSNSVPNFAAQWIARRWKIRGPARCYIAACATGTVAMIEGAHMVQDGIVDYCLAGASDASIVPLMLAGYYQMKTLSPDEIRPFDKRRKGFLIGEGAAVFVLEREETARARGVPVYGRIAGFAYGCNTSGPVHFDEKEGALKTTLEQLLRKDKNLLSEIDYVALHATGTKSGDIYETRQIKAALGKRAYQIPMSSIKPMTGHMLGASGAVQAAACLIGMRENFLPPTMNLEQPDPECDLDYIPLKLRETKNRTAVSISMGFGGHVAVLALRKD